LNLPAAVWDVVTRPVRLCFDPEYRSRVRLKLFSARELHQTTSLTWMDRYPHIFATCRRYFDQRPNLRILSFGCATGEEVLTLRQYFPDASIVGAELNRRSLAICERLDVDDRIQFTFSRHDLIAERGPFDAVFCMAVLQRGPHRVQQERLENLKELYPFEKFDEQVRKLDSLIRTGGLFIICRTQYDLGDTSVGGKYEPLEQAAPDGFPRFDRDSRLKPPADRTSSIFIKRRD
jgi:hypothetical protein